ncbi:MAG: methyltetrahydrofolate cobalamin methyltransferase [Dehalococcoidia bacterium]|nr:MAG: methyltetrahydrofolate cobalamin methyltransferase [Dehalococcoidia bacterium]
MLIIGEKINATSKQVAEAIGHRDGLFLQELARQQVDAGAHYLDVNAGRGQGSEQEAEDLKWAIDTVQAATGVPLSIDSSDSQAIKAALAHCRGNAAIINSVNAEEGKLSALLPLALEHQAGIIALAMDDSGVPKDVEGRLRACNRILERAVAHGIPLERIFLDPLALPLSVDTDQGMVTLRTLEQIKARWPQAKTTLGLSNASYGLPLRGVINRALLLMAIYLGLDSVILDPLDARLMAHIKAAQVVLGRDPFCKGYLNDYRKGRIRE